MTVEEAIARFRARWAHPPVDPRDVEERVAVRLDYCGPETEARVIAFPPAVRVFISRSPGAPWRSAYVHDLGDVDAVVDALLRPISVSRRKTRASKAA